MKILLIFIIVVLVFCGIGYWTNRQLENEELTLPIKNLPNGLDGVKIVHVSDIHYKRLRVNHELLISTIAQQQPDLIFVTGDTVDRTENVTTSNIQELINCIAAFAPTYLIEGNHERTSGQFEEWHELMKNSNAILLENDIKTVRLHDESISIIGLRNEMTNLPDQLKTKLAGNRVTLMLAHHPELFESYVTNFQSYLLHGIFSGHAHGGQVRLPFIDGLLSPDQGLFPKYTNGRYTTKEKTETNLFVSRGLSNSKFPFRINNKPHLITITLKTAN